MNKQNSIWEGKCPDCGTINYSMLEINFVICRNPKCCLAFYDSKILEGEEYKYHKQNGTLEDFYLGGIK